MNDPMVISMVVGVGVIALIGGLVFVMTKRGDLASLAEQRLDGLTGKPLAKGKPDPASGILLRPPAIDLGTTGVAARDAAQPREPEHALRAGRRQPAVQPVHGDRRRAGGDWGRWSGSSSSCRSGCSRSGRSSWGSPRSSGCCIGSGSGSRSSSTRMPEAVELISRGLRAGHGLASGMQLVAEEMKGPIADEFGRVFEEQNLGIPIELSLRGDGRPDPADGRPLLRDRRHHPARHRRRPRRGPRQDRQADPPAVRAGRARQGADGRGPALGHRACWRLPPGLLAFLSFSNYGYVSALFNTPAGNKMLLITAGLQLLGALMIKKIVAIKV